MTETATTLTKPEKAEKTLYDTLKIEARALKTLADLDAFDDRVRTLLHTGSVSGEERAFLQGICETRRDSIKTDSMDPRVLEQLGEWRPPQVYVGDVVRWRGPSQSDKWWPAVVTRLNADYAICLNVILPEVGTLDPRNVNVLHVDDPRLKVDARRRSGIWAESERVTETKAALAELWKRLEALEAKRK